MQSKACGTQESECTFWYVRNSSTAQRGYAPPQPLIQRVLSNTPDKFARTGHAIMQVIAKKSVKKLDQHHPALSIDR